MTQFQSLGAFAAHLIKVNATVVIALHTATEKIGQIVEARARAEFGTYQPAVGNFPAWDELAETTKDDRVRQGYTENDPLLRSGAMRDETGHSSTALEVLIGSKDPVMVFQEFGTSKMPARPVFGPALVNSENDIHLIVGAALMSGLVGNLPIHSSLGYNFQTKP